MIFQPANIQVRHHPESKHICANGKDSSWASFGEMGIHKAAEHFVSMISSELTLDVPVRVEVRDEHRPNTVYDVTVYTKISHSAAPTYPERNAIDYQDIKAGGETNS